ncbi:MAG: acyl-CoA thioesterase [Desulfurispora sp.]|uniref:acyl-CoA thioesterase n=1 Tax=Desulfurispora sp. TaxID=3014275 RepID=UPI00404AFD6C
MESELAVRFSECDPMGVVHHANYFVWFEVGRLAVARAAGIDVRGMAKERVFMPVLHCECRFRESARFDDTILVRTALLPPRAARLEFVYEVMRLPGHVPLASGRTVHAVIVPGRGMLLSLPAEMKQRIEEFLNQ